MTTTGIKYPGTVTQNTASTYIQWQNLNNIKTGTNSAQTNRVETNKTPAPITCADFNLGLPSYNKITKIEFTYKHRKNPYQGSYPAFAEPVIMLYDGGTLLMERVGNAPSATMTERSVAFAGEWRTDDIDDPINLKIVLKYPKNTGNYAGYIEIQWVAVKITYKSPSYLMQIYTGGDTYANQRFELYFTVNDKNNAGVIVPGTITIPSGMTVEGFEGEEVDLNLRVYNSDSLPCYATCANTGTYPVTLTMDNGDTKTLNVVVTAKPTTYDDSEVFLEENTYYTMEDLPFNIHIKLNSELDYTGISNIYLFCDKQIQYKNGSSYTTLNANTGLAIPISSFSEYEYIFNLKTSNGINKIYLSTQNEMPNDATYIVYTTPASIYPYYPLLAVIPLSDVELELLSDGEVYSVESELKVNRLTSSGTFTNYYRNYRMGVVNSVNQTSDLETIFQNCNNWSDVITGYDEYELKTVEFTYNNDYPVYIIFTGDYDYDSSLTDCQLQFKPPLLYLSEDERPINYDIIQLKPLHNSITDTDYAETQLEAYQSTAPSTVYGFDVDEDLQTSENRAIRGIELYGHITTSQKLGITATLINPDDDECTQSIIVTGDNEFKIGNSYDLWGYSIGDMINLSDWEVKIQINNTFVNNTNDVMLNSLYLKVYYIDIDPQTVTVKVNGEILGWYGFFLRNAKVPMGLKMNTQYMEIDGADTYDPVNQAVREKEIELEGSIDGCDINETTQLVKQLTKLLVTERDGLNRPIPNILELSNYPDEHWEYILENVFDTEIDAASYDTTIKLTVPDGVSYSNDDTVTGPIGRVNSLTKVNPIITVANIQTDNLQITEENTGQTWTINYPFEDTDVIEIDCLTRTVELNPVDPETYGDELNTYVDINSDWFYLNKSYHFTCETAVIQSVRYNQRG